jgi:nitrate reductase NapE component
VGDGSREDKSEQRLKWLSRGGFLFLSFSLYGILETAFWAEYGSLGILTVIVIAPVRGRLDVQAYHRNERDGKQVQNSIRQLTEATHAYIDSQWKQDSVDRSMLSRACLGGDTPAPIAPSF